MCAQNLAEIPPENYAEESRKFRRTVYGHEDWVKHRSSTRLFRNLATTLDSGVVRALGTEVATVTLIALAVTLGNMVVGGYDDLSYVHQPALLANSPFKQISMPALPFTLTMPALALLLVFRTNTAYFRWNEARTLWGGVVNKCRNLVRQGGTYFPDTPEGREMSRKLTNQTAAFCNCLRTFLRGPEHAGVLEAELPDLLGAEAAAACLAANNRPVFMLNMLSKTIRDAKIDPIDRARMDDTLSVLLDLVGANERVFKSPIPLVYTRHTARFLTAWLLLLPFALWTVTGDSWNHWLAIPASGVLSIFLFGIEELGIQIEEPFGVLPLEVLCKTSIGAVNTATLKSWEEGEFGL